MDIPVFPDFVPLELEHKDELVPYFQKAGDGVSEFTFSGLYLFRKKYGYEFSRDGDGTYIFRGESYGRKFFSAAAHFPQKDTLDVLFNQVDYWRNIPQSIVEKNSDLLSENRIEVAEDRDNFDYLYLSSDLAELSGKKFHKKRNLVNAFLLSTPNHSEFPLTIERKADAIHILERWKEEKADEGDFVASLEALNNMVALGLEGLITYIDDTPAAYCLGEALGKSDTFAIHFEKGIDAYKGIYQFINMAFARSVQDKYTYLNREQDLGEEGMRQAKMTYRPVGFVQKYQGVKH
jgi:hypothetical protein